MNKPCNFDQYMPNNIKSKGKNIKIIKLTIIVTFCGWNKTLFASDRTSIKTVLSVEKLDPGTA